MHTYRSWLKKVDGHNPRHPLPDADKIVIPGTQNLFDFSADYDDVLKARDEGGHIGKLFPSAAIGGMIVGLRPANQKRMAAQLVRTCGSGSHAGRTHVVRFPPTQYHVWVFIVPLIVVSIDKETDDAHQFSAYDPNEREKSGWVPVTFQPARGSFLMCHDEILRGGRTSTSTEIYSAGN